MEKCCSAGVVEIIAILIAFVLKEVTWLRYAEAVQQTSKPTHKEGTEITVTSGGIIRHSFRKSRLMR